MMDGLKANFVDAFSRDASSFSPQFMKEKTTINVAQPLSCLFFFRSLS